MDTTIPFTQREGDVALKHDQSVVDGPAIIALLQTEAEEETRFLQGKQESMTLSSELEHDKKTN